MNNSNFDTFSNRAVNSAIEKYGSRQDNTGELEQSQIYVGPNIRAFMAANNLDPSLWRQLLEYNNIGSLLNLVEGQTQLTIPRIFSK